MHVRNRRLLLPFAAIPLMVACAKTDAARSADTSASASAVSATPAAGSPTIVTIIASDYKYEAPDTITAGMVSLRVVNKGPELHHVQLFRFTGGKTYADFLAGMKEMKPNAPLPPWIEVVAGPNAPVPGGEHLLTEELTPGNYAIICLIPSPDHVPHFVKGMMRPLTVIPATGAVAAVPASDITVKMTD